MKILIQSDTHGLHYKSPDLPVVDVYIHAGDFMNKGRDPQEIYQFNQWVGSRAHAKRKLVVAGNHDVILDETHPSSDPSRAKQAREMLTNCEYLQDEALVVEGVHFYFSPWTPEFYGWGFNAKRGPEIAEIWKKIPDYTRILVTHGPPHGILDQIVPGVQQPLVSQHLGCEELRKRISNLLNLQYHIFGHIHGSRGMWPTVQSKTTYINASFLNELYKPHPGPGYFLIET